MLSRVITGSGLLIPMLLAAPAASAQRVSADVRIWGGPVAGHIRIGPDRYQPRYRDYYRDYRPRIVRVEVLRVRDFRRHPGWFREFRRTARVYIIYRDPDRDFYYDRYRPGLVECEVYERDGRFYRWEDDR
jgi:hypothetical protein